MLRIGNTLRAFQRPSALTLDPTNGKTCTDPRGPVLGGPYGPPSGGKKGGTSAPIFRSPDDETDFRKHHSQWLTDLVADDTIIWASRGGKLFPA